MNLQSVGVAKRRELSSLPSDGFVRIGQIVGDPDADPPIIAAIPVSKSRWWEGVRQGKYPAAIKLGPATTVWKVSDIRALIDRLAQTPPDNSRGADLTEARKMKRRKIKQRKAA
jgi:prophage regulatory protein